MPVVETPGPEPAPPLVCRALLLVPANQAIDTGNVDNREAEPCLKLGQRRHASPSYLSPPGLLKNMSGNANRQVKQIKQIV